MFSLLTLLEVNGMNTEEFCFLSSGLGASMPTLVGRSVGWSVCLSLEKMSKIVKNQEFRLHLKTKVVDLLE